MGIADRLRAIFAQPSQSKQAPIVYMNGVSGKGRRDRYEDFAKEGYKENAIVYRCVNEIANGAAAVTFNAFLDKDKIENHPILRLLSRPNPRKAGVEYFQSLYAYILLSGNAYGVYAGPDNAPPRELYLLRPDRVRIIPGETDIPKGYDYIINGQVRQTYPVQIDGRSEVKHFSLWNPLDDWYGLSPLNAAAVDVDQHNLAAQHNVGLLMNGARPSGAIIFKPKDETGMGIQLTESQRQQLISDMESRFSGTKNVARPMLLEGDFDWKEMSLSPKDMDFLELKNMAAKDIALCFGVPGQLVGIPDNQTYSNVAEARLALYEETIIPMLRRVESDINEWLVPLYREPSLRVAYDIDSIPAIAERRRRVYENVVQGVNAGIISRNEARDRLGLTAVEGADDLYIPANLFPLGKVAPIDAGTPEKAYEEAYGEKRIIEIYPDGEPVPENLPAAYRPHGSYRMCHNCGYYDDDYCELFDAEVRDRYVCNDWISHTDDRAEKAEIDLKPTEAMAEEAARALQWRKEGNVGGTLVGVARANQLVNRENLSESTVLRMYSFFARHEVDKQAEGFRPGEDGYPSPGRVAWGLWGGDPGFSWARAKRRQIMADDKAVTVKVGDFVEWDSSGGMARGRITRIVRSGTLKVPGTDFTLNATEDDPAVLIRIYGKDKDGKWAATTTIVGHRVSTLTKIPDLD